MNEVAYTLLYAAAFAVLIRWAVEAWREIVRFWLGFALLAIAVVGVLGAALRWYGGVK